MKQVATEVDPECKRWKRLSKERKSKTAKFSLLSYQNVQEIAREDHRGGTTDFIKATCISTAVGSTINTGMAGVKRGNM